jgi:hypothetical protein
MGLVVGIIAGFVAFVCSLVFGTVVVLQALDWIAAYGLMTVGIVAAGGFAVFGFVAGMAIGLTLS